MASFANIKIEQGTTFDVVIDITDDLEQAYDLTGFTVKSQMKKSYYTNTYHNLSASVYGDPTNGQILLEMNPAESLAIKPGRYVYDVIIRNANDVIVERVIEGVINLTPATTSL